MQTALVIPCYNEAKRLDFPVFEKFLQQNPDITFCFVNDGSKDNTLALLQKFAAQLPNQVQVIDQPKNEGKAEAVRTGMLASAKLNKYQVIGYWDADLAVPLSELPRMLTVFQKQPDLIALLGSRVKLLGYKIERKAYRHYLGRIFATAASIFLKLPVYDTQCGAKLFNQKCVSVIFQEPLLTGWIFDVEILLRLEYWISENYKPVQSLENYINEMPLLAWKEIEGSQVKLKHYFIALRDFLRLIKLKLTKYHK